MKNRFVVVSEDKELYFEQKIKLLNLIPENERKNYLCAKVNNRIRELTYDVHYDAKVDFLSISDEEAMFIYENSLRYIIAMALYQINPNIQLKYSYYESRSIYGLILNDDIKMDQALLDKLKDKINEIVKNDYPFVRKIVPNDEAEIIYRQFNMLDKIDLLKYRPEKTAHIYNCNGYKNYMYSRMVPSTGYINKYKIRFYSPGIIIQYPRSEANGEIPPFEDAPTFGRTLKQAHQWAIATGANTVVGINEHVEKDGVIDFINLCESRHNRQLCELGQMIENDIDNIRIICIAGPSSSGKTTFANRLRIELLSRGIKPIRISMDDYYLPRHLAPKDENGEPDLESVDALDKELFNQNMSDLISGMEVELPKFDFLAGKRVKGRTLKVPQNQPIIIEGIHALNDIMTSSIPNHQKFKIFIAPQAQINIDNENPISLTDLRLLRRIVRDYQFRNASAIDTIAMWPSVRKGEFKWIYSTQEGANYVFNSLLSYELCAMKKYAMPLLLQIDVENEYYPVAERLIRMLKFFIDMPDEWVPCNSLLREFIGNSCYADV